MEKQETQEIIKFYSRRQGYFEFTNFYVAPIQLDGKEWPTTEHYYQSQKFAGVDDKYAETVRNSKGPGEARKLANQNSSKYRKDWFKINEEVMYKCCLAKFTQHKDLEKLLISTRTAILQEDSKDDYFWGIGADGTGKNMLGKILMRIRDELKATKKGAGTQINPDSNNQKEESKTST